EMESIRKRVSSGNSPAWRTSYPEMFRKSAVRRLFKTLPISLVDKAGKFAAIEDLADETGRAVHIDSDDYSVMEEEQAHASNLGEESASADPPETTGDDRVDIPQRASGGAVADVVTNVIKGKHSARLKKALQQSVVQAAAEAVIDPETGEILESETL